jgi:hypothetical protein
MEMPLHRRHNESSTGYRGVELRESGRHAVEIMLNRKRIWLGTFGKV